jgi:hypothetical protein
MSGAGSWEQALIELSSVLLPFGEEVGGPTAASTAAGITAAVIPFCTLVTINLVALSLRHYLVRIALGVVEYSISLLLGGFLLKRFLSRKKDTSILRARLREQRATREKQKKARVQTTFQSWEQFCQGTVFWSFGGELNEDAKRALSILGLHSFSTQSELRKAYLELMKQHHPDRVMHTPTDFEEAQNKAVTIREAYDVIAKQFCRVQC